MTCFCDVLGVLAVFLLEKYIRSESFWYHLGNATLGKCKLTKNDVHDILNIN